MEGYAYAGPTTLGESALGDTQVAAALDDWRARQTTQVADAPSDEG